MFYESLLPHLVSEEELDRVSSAGYAIGYLGGGVLLAVNLLMIQRPAWFGIPDAGTAVRLSLASVGVWWLVFSIPLFRRVPEPARRIEADESPSAAALLAPASRRLVETFRELRRYSQAFLLLVAFLVYNDGIQTIIRMATTFGSQIGIDQNAMITALLITQFIGVPFAFLFGMVAERIGAKTAIFVGLASMPSSSALGYYMTTRGALLCARDHGRHGAGRNPGAQPIALRQHDPAAQVVGVLRVLRRLRDVCRHPRPLVFAAMVDATGQSRNAMLAVLGFFVVGGAMLVFVDVDAGRRAARARPRQQAAPDDGTMRAQSGRPLARPQAGRARIFYRDWIAHRTRRRATGAVLLLPNHPNALLDPALVWATAERDVRFLAKSTLFDGHFGRCSPVPAQSPSIASSIGASTRQEHRDVRRGLGRAGGGRRGLHLS